MSVVGVQLQYSHRRVSSLWMTVPSCRSKWGQYLSFVSLNMIRLNVRAPLHVNLIFRILLIMLILPLSRRWFRLIALHVWSAYIFLLHRWYKERTSSCFCREHQKKWNKTKNILFCENIFTNSVEGYFFLVYAYVRILYILCLKQPGPKLRYIYINQSWIHLNRVSPFLTCTVSVFLLFQEAIL